MTADELKEKENPYKHIVDKLNSVAIANNLNMMCLPDDEEPQKHAILDYLRHALITAEEAGLLDE